MDFKYKIDKTTGINIENKVLQTSFQYVIVGPPESGKSSLVVNLIRDPRCYLQKFDEILFITPTPFGKELIQLEEGVNWYKSFSPSWLSEKINEFEQINKKEKEIENILVVIDDCAGQLKSYEKDVIFNELVYNRRHYKEFNISLILVVQKWNLIPLSWRVMTTGLFLFRVPAKQFDEIFKEVIINNPPCFKKMFVLETKINPHAFYFINNLNNKIYNNKLTEVFL